MKTPLYALLGSGRLARHLRFYLEALRLPIQVWSRNGDPQFNSFHGAETLPRTLHGATHVLLAVSDRAIEELGERIPRSKICVHFSGAKQIPGMFAAHPLMSFSNDLLTVDAYPQIPFVVDPGIDLAHVLPGFPNPNYPLHGSRPKYHALCSLAGNATFLLWREIFEVFERDLKLPRSVLKPFLKQNLSNAFDQRQSLTGPVARGDREIVRSHMQSLAGEPALTSLYKTYLQVAKQRGFPVEESP